MTTDGTWTTSQTTVHDTVDAGALAGGAPGGAARDPDHDHDRDGAAAGTLVVGSFNLHAGIDGWGRPYDAVAACAAIDADILVLEETWTPEGRPGIAEAVAEQLGYSVVQHQLGGGRRAGPHPDADDRWMRRFDWRGASHAIYLDSERPLGPRVRATQRFKDAEPGHWGIAVLTRLPLRAHRVIDLGRPLRDRARRAVIVVEVAVGDRTLVVGGAHMTHLTYGSPVHFLRLRRVLDEAAGDRPAVVAGDMNLWGPPVSLLLAGWRRALRKPTWPAWRPHSQVDHVLVRGAVDVSSGEVLPMSGSDHRPVRVRLRLAG